MKDEERSEKQMDENALQKKLGNIKKELKCWESMFVRGNGRKPTKDDIECTGNEIRGTYKEYAILKDQLNKFSKGKSVANNKEGETKSNCEIEKTQNVAAKSNNADDDDDVFGKSLNKSSKQGKTDTPSHLKEQSLAKKHKFSFAHKRHLKAPFRNGQEIGNSDGPTNSMQNEQKVNSQVQPIPDAVDDNKLATDNDNHSEDTLKENDLLGNGVLGKVEIISNSADRAISFRKFTKVSKTTSVSGRNYKLSKEWLEKLKPQEESNKTEEMFANEIFDDQIEIDSGPRNNNFDNESIFEGSETDRNLQSTGKERINRTSNEESMYRNISYDKFDNDTFTDNNITRSKESETNFNFENIAPSVSCQDPDILQHEKFPGTDVASQEPDIAENRTSSDTNVKTKYSETFNDVESSSIGAKTKAIVNDSNYGSSPSTYMKTHSSHEHKTQHINTSVKANQLYDNKGNVVEARTNDSRKEGHSGSYRLKFIDNEDVAKKEAKTRSVQQKRKNTDDSELGNGTAGNDEVENASNEAKRAKKGSAADTKAIPKVPRGKRLVSENFVKIDIQKKRFCRGKRSIKGSTYKRQQWKKKTQFNTKSATTKCYKCGSDGHWAKECGKRSTKGNPARFSSFDGKKTEDFLPVHQSEDVPGFSGFSIEDVPELPRPWPRIPYHPPRPAAPVGALYEPVDGQPSNVAIKEINKALRSLGYTSFRAGQEKAIARIVSGLSTLLVLSTGSGKSLCYQIPAYLFYKKAKYLTIVISPLVALMEDQVGNLPYGLKGACLHANMTKPQREKVMKDVTDGKIAILLLSPEALVSGSTATGYLPMLGSLPPIAFACIDEAHCVSEWSHNFRPKYLRVCKVLRDILGVHCFLGLTATSTKATSMSITKHLGIDEAESEDAIIRGSTMPDNLHITVSRDEDRDQALVSLLSGERFHKCISIIIYCTRREETERLSAILRTCLHNLPPTELDVDDEEDKDTPKPKAKRKGKGSKKPKLRTVAWDADSYHAGMTPAHRRRVQKKFMSGELRIVVATTAFGMGLDKADVRAIIHYNMPKSFESYLQEIGRAGRDGLPAHCHVFIDEEAKDLCELRRHTYSNSVDMKSIKRLVNRVFKHCDCKERTLAAEASKPIQCNDNVSSGKGPEGRSGSCVISSDKNFQGENGEIVMEDDLMEEYFADDFDIEALEDNRPNPGKEQQQVAGADMTTERGVVSTDITIDTSTINPESIFTGATCQPDIIAETSTIDSKSSPTNETCQTSTNQEDDNLQSDTSSRYCVGHHVTFSIEQTVQDLDMPEENISTLLSYLELHPEAAVTLHNPIKSRCTVQCYGGARQMKLLAIKFLPLTAVFNNMRRNEMKLADAKAVTFNAVEIADEMGWDLDPIYRELRSVQWKTQFALSQGDSLIGKSGVMVELDDQSFHVISQGDLSHDERDHICGILHKMVKEQEKTRILQLDALYNILSKNSHSTYHDIVSSTDASADEQLRESIQEYFGCRPSEMRALLEKLSPEKIEIPVPECKWTAISRDTRTMLGLHHDVMFSGRALARIFHGIDSPCYPAVVWGRDRRFWRRYLDVDFNDLRMFITKEIIKYRT